MSEIKIFPIGYIASTNTNSKGNFVASQLSASATNLLFEPNAGCNKVKAGYTSMSTMDIGIFLVRFNTFLKGALFMRLLYKRTQGLRLAWPALPALARRA